MNWPYGLLFIIAYLAVGLVIIIIDQAYAPNKEETLIFFLWIFWPILIGMYTLGLAFKFIRWSGDSIRFAGVKVSQKYILWKNTPRGKVK